MKQHMHGYTLIEVLLALGATAALVGGVAAIVTPAMQASRDDTLTAAENIQLSRTTDQLIDDIASGEMILRQASTQRLDFLKLTALQPTQLPRHLGNGKETQIQLDTNVFGPYAGKDVVLTNTTGDYLITKVEKTEAAGGKWITTFECPLTLPGTLTAHTFAPLNIASTQATGGGGQPNSLYRDSGGGWELASTGVGRVTFQPGEGAPFTADLQPVEREIKQLSIGLGNEGDRTANTLAPAVINPAAWKEWSCGEGMTGRPENNLGDLQINVALEGNPNPSNPGVSPSVAASGPQNQSLSRFGTQVFEKLKPGLYNVSANTITIGGNPYDPVITGSPANIGKGRAGTVNVNYVERRGIMTITVSGLPAGQTGQVRVQGRENKTLPKSIAGIPVIDQPGGAFLINLKNGEYPIELLPGEYTVTAAGSGTLDAVVTPGTLAVRPGQNSPVSVAYAAAQGSATVQVRGLHPGEQTTVSLTSSAGTQQHTMTGDETGYAGANIPLNPGTYTVSGSQIPGRTLSISPPTLTIVPRQTGLTLLSYTSNGTMQVTVKGLVSGEQGKVSVAGPQNVSQSLGEGTFNINLQPGSYTVSAEPVNGKTPVVTPANVAITSNKTAGVVVEYKSLDPNCDPSVDATCETIGTITPLMGSGSVETKSKQSAKYGTANDDLFYLAPQAALPLKTGQEYVGIGFTHMESNSMSEIGGGTEGISGTRIHQVGQGFKISPDQDIPDSTKLQISMTFSIPSEYELYGKESEYICNWDSKKEADVCYTRTFSKTPFPEKDYMAPTVTIARNVTSTLGPYKVNYLRADIIKEFQGNLGTANFTMTAGELRQTGGYVFLSMGLAAEDQCTTSEAGSDMSGSETTKCTGVDYFKVALKTAVVP